MNLLFLGVAMRKPVPKKRKSILKTNSKTKPNITIIKKTTHQIQSRKLTTADRVMLKALAQMPDSQIDYTEIPEIDWTQVKIVKKPTKKQIAFRVDSDILEFF